MPQKSVISKVRLKNESKKYFLLCLHLQYNATNNNNEFQILILILLYITYVILSYLKYLIL